MKTMIQKYALRPSQMKRGANTRNQDTEAGSRYPSILRTSSTEKTVKLNSAVYWIVLKIYSASSLVL